MAKGRCPTCGAHSVGRHKPFCSDQCAKLDLGRWLSGVYAVPAVEPPDGGELAALVEAAEASGDTDPDDADVDDDA